MYVQTPGIKLNVGTSLVQRIDGLGCADCGGTCGKGLGLFESGMDLSGWGWPEMAIVGLGVYMVVSTVFTTKRGVQRVSKSVQSRTRKSKRRRELQQELSRL